VQPAEVIAYVVERAWNEQLTGANRTARFHHMRCRKSGYEYGIKRFLCTASYKGKTVSFTLLGDGEVVHWSGPQ
jgi:hypothetical protein